jgi:hypothetical protein
MLFADELTLDGAKRRSYQQAYWMDARHGIGVCLDGSQRFDLELLTATTTCWQANRRPSIFPSYWNNDNTSNICCTET